MSGEVWGEVLGKRWMVIIGILIDGTCHPVTPKIYFLTRWWQLRIFLFLLAGSFQLLRGSGYLATGYI